MTLLALTLLVSAAPNMDTGLDRLQLSRVLHASAAAMRDVEFLYEGSMRNLTKKDPSAVDRFEDGFQGTFAYRNDGSAHLDVYIECAHPDRPSYRETFAVRGTELARRVRNPDRPKPISNVDQFGPGSLGTLNRPRSPLRILLLPGLLSFLDDETWKVEPEGWEEVNGRRCLRIAASHPGNSVRRYWLDLERDGMPLRYESSYPGRVTIRAFDVELAQVADEIGRQFWLPVRGKCRTFGNAGEPEFEETYVVLDGTVRINQGLPDSRFTPDSESTLNAPVIARQKDRYATALKTPKPGSITPQEHIESLLAKADAQSARLEASAPSREPWYRRNLYSIMLVGGGGMTLIVATLLLRRGR